MKTKTTIIIAAMMLLALNTMRLKGQTRDSYTITYTTNGIVETETTTVEQGSLIDTLIEPTEAYIPNGFAFVGWYAGDIVLHDEAPMFVSVGDAIDGDMTLRAVFALVTSPAIENWSLVTDLSTVTDGTYALLTTDYHAFNGTITSGHGQVTTETFEFADGIATSSPEDVCELTLTASGDGFTMRNSENKYLYAAANASGKLRWQDEETSYWYHSEGDWLYHANSAYLRSYNNNSIRTYKSNSYGNDLIFTRKNDATPAVYGHYCTTVTDIVSGAFPIVDGIMTSDATVPAGGAYTLSESVTIPDGITLTVNGILGNEEPGFLIIEDGGQVVVNNGGVQATCKKTIVGAAKDAEHWYTIASPVDNVRSTNVTNLITSDDEGFSYDLYRYDEANMLWENQKTHPAYFTHLNNGRGYLYYNSTGSDLQFTGALNSGDIEYFMTVTDNALSGLHLIGNPYPHNIYKGDGAAIDSDKLAEGYYTLTNDSGWTAHLGYSEAIRPGQGVLVKATEPFTLNISNTATPATAKQASRNNIMFAVANSKFEDVAYALFSEGTGLDKICHHNTDVPMLYIEQDGKDYAIATFNDDVRQFNLNFKATTTGRYTLKAKVSGDYGYMHVVDKMTGDDVDLLLENEYVFMAAPSDKADRFIIRLDYSEFQQNSENSTFAHQSGNDIIIRGAGELQVFNLTGQIVLTMPMNNVETMRILHLQSGVYILKLNDKMQKIVVK